MMKTKHLLPLVWMTLALGACSDNTIPGNEHNGASWDSEGKGYVTLALNLPTERVSRANESFEDGLESEYRVHNATLILFAGTDEASAAFHSAYKLDLNGWNQETGQVTTSTKIVQKINQIDADKKVYALVVLNENGFLTVSEDAGLTINTEIGKGFSAISGTTSWSDFNKVLTISADKSFTKTGLLMANAPLTNKPGGTTQPDGTVFTLADVDETKIYDTYVEASNNPAVSIYVERAVAKVTVNATLEGTTTGGGNQSYAIEGWCLDQTNTLSYLVRKVASSPTWLAYKSGGSNDYRFVGNTSIDGKYYRTYWGEDPNYDENTKIKDFAIVAATDDPSPFKAGFGVDHPAYCLENTFNVATQDKDKTTRVIVKAQFNGGTSFYLHNRDESTLYNKEGMENLFKAAFLKEPTIEAWIKSNLISGQPVVEGDLTLAFDKAEQAKGVMKLTGVTIADGKLKDDAESLRPGNAMELTNASVGTVNYYADGMAYYSVLIKHFGDDQTPWNTWENPRPSITTIYPGPNVEPNYLGRYGVLRNNWYDLTINKIKNIGDPIVPTLDGKDDDLDAYISVTINVLSWAKRTQGVDL